MYRTLSAVLLTVLVASLGSAAYAAPPQHSEKAAWQWTAEERIAKRVDPVQRAARRARTHGAPARPAGFTPLDGSREPELFLPVELVTSLILDNAAPHQLMRNRHRAAIEAAGWDFAQFWVTLDAAAAPYIALMNYSGQLQRQARGRADLGRLKPQICAAAADLLSAARTTFGNEAFDRFLYRHVAPSIRTEIADHSETAVTLSARSKGCR